MNGVVHPYALVLARAYPTTVENCQLAIMQAEADLDLAEAIVRVFVMANVWPDVQRMKENLRAEAAGQRDGEALASLLPREGITVE